MALLQDFFLLSLHKRKQRDYYIKFVQDTIGLYEAGNLHYNTSEIAERMFVTSKTINRYFHQVVGISPKKYFSIVRARTALTAYVRDKKTFLPDDYGYHDMSHFYKDVNKFTGSGYPS